MVAGRGYGIWLGSREMHKAVGWGNRSERDHSEDLGIDRG
jgi:hypothetical protein